MKLPASGFRVIIFAVVILYFRAYGASTESDRGSPNGDGECDAARHHQCAWIRGRRGRYCRSSRRSPFQMRNLMLTLEKFCYSTYLVLIDTSLSRKKRFTGGRIPLFDIFAFIPIEIKQISISSWSPVIHAALPVRSAPRTMRIPSRCKPCSKPSSMRSAFFLL